MLRTSLAIAFALTVCANAVAAPMGGHLKTRAVSLTKRVHVMPFTAAEQLIMDRASASWGGGGEGGSGGGDAN